MKDKENKMVKGNIYKLSYLSRTGRFHYDNVKFVRYMGNDEFVDEEGQAQVVAPWMVNENTEEVNAFGKYERNFLRQDW